MNTSDDTDGKEYGEVKINDRGRLTIPKELRDNIGIESGTVFTVTRGGNTIRLVRQPPELQTVSTGRSREEWDDDAFRDAGRATFGGQ